MRRENLRPCTQSERNKNGRSVAIYPDRVRHLLEHAFVALEIALRGDENDEQQALGAPQGDQPVGLATPPPIGESFER
jgi:hypothetical protein